MFHILVFSSQLEHNQEKERQKIKTKVTSAYELKGTFAEKEREEKRIEMFIRPIDRKSYKRTSK